MRFRSRRPSAIAPLAILIACGSACVAGAISDPGPDKASSASPGAGGGNAGGGTASTGAGGAGGGPGTAGTTAGGRPVLDVGRTTLRRLNRVEYNNTVRDLLGSALTPADNFPADDVSDGFDTIGATLGMSTLLTQELESAAASLVDELFARPATDPVRTRIVTCTPAPGSETTCAQQILSAFLPRAFRRPVDSTEVASFVSIMSTAIAAAPAGDAAGRATAAQDGLKAALEAALLSPNFLFLVEKDTMPGSAAPVPLNDYELAARLSYLLWSSMPDDALTAAAQAGKLAGKPDAIAAQVSRMLADPKATAFAQDFGGQWLQVHFLDTVTPSTKIFPSYDDGLRTSALTETVLFFQDLVNEDLPLESLVTAKFSMLNARLGQQYGVPVSGTGFVKTSLDGTPRIGILTQDSLLMGKSYPDRTSPVKRGYFVLSQLLCIPPPPPPPNVPALVTGQADAGTTMRQQLDAHASNPQCAGCHTLMDPIGYGLEHFDAIGGFRTADNGVAIDATGTLGGVSFDGAEALAKVVASHPQYVPCVTQQLLTYGVGRSFDAGDAQAYAAALGSQAVKQGHGTWRGLISAVASSDAFMTRRGESMP